MSRLPRVDGPEDLPELRNWLLERHHPNGLLGKLDTPFVHRALQTAQLWWVEEPTCHLLAESAPTWPDDATLDLHNLPTPSGLAVLAHDIVGIDAVDEDASVRVSAIVWGPVTLPPAEVLASGVREGWFRKDTGRAGLGIGMFTRLDLHKGLDHGDLTRSAGILHMLQSDLFQPGAKAGDSVFFGPGHEGTLYAYVGRTDWLDGWPASKAIEDSPSYGNAIGEASMAEDRKLLATLWALTRTTLVQVMRTRPARYIARRSERKKLSADVRVLRLGGQQTQTVGYSPPIHKRDWKHSWIVRPHWRWQAHGPMWSERKLILVGPYTKGDPSLPLIGGERVWSVQPPPGYQPDTEISD
jgi:hypothetical protein